jgi:hypothetical protein
MRPRASVMTAAATWMKRKEEGMARSLPGIVRRTQIDQLQEWALPATAFGSDAWFKSGRGQGPLLHHEVSSADRGNA